MARREQPNSGGIMANLVVHFEIHASEPQRLIDYYSELLGWSFTQYGDDYWVIETGDGAIGNTAGQPGMGINGGLTRRDGPAPEAGAPVNGCNIVVGVDDIDGLMRRGVELGGTEALAAADWPGIGRGGYLLDPDHNLIGLISPVLSDGTTAMGPDATA
jgi:predicted enzyme related to lactoylglutathione lyase